MKNCSKLLSPVTMEGDWGAVFQDPILNHSISCGKGFLTTDCSTLYPFGEVVLHDNDVNAAVLSRFERVHEIYVHPLIEGAIGGLL